MSLVGPRPHAVIHDEEFSEKMRGYEKRFQVLPGMTGLAQIRGHRGSVRCDTDIQLRLSSDLEYISDLSFINDLKILWRTLPVFFFQKNAF